ncbi:Na+/H+ antiporter subunit E [Hydrogenophaga sp.]|uniref:Na+/H+ antiporter subunit E n=1 Tax=Hydrogenophaga sp. TaxID=1904254 RepID=UPI00271B0BF5|nr:Na+/H+ antiporter subunit E [Hydrogenophaga sp.]MDO8904756.1 Na+/H+ antiporter subunit E [Hydrogenophaga sp.]
MLQNPFFIKRDQTLKSLVLFFVMAVLWVLWSGLYLPLLLGLGLASCVLVVLLVRRFDRFGHSSVPMHPGKGIVTYWFWLIKEIVFSSLQVTRIILSPRLQISPRLITVVAIPRGEVARVVLGNSITLTPGTLTTDIDDNGIITVHALTNESAEDVLSGEMNRRVGRLEGKP